MPRPRSNSGNSVVSGERPGREGDRDVVRYRWGNREHVISRKAGGTPRRGHSVPGPAAYRVGAMLTLMRVPF